MSAFYHPNIPASADRNEIVFIDSGIDDVATVLAAVEPGRTVVLLEAGQDGLQQIADHLDGRTGIDAVHIVSHGSPGAVHLG